MTQIVHSPNPLLPIVDQKIYAGIEHRPGETIGEVIRRAGIDINHTPVHVRVNGSPIVRGFLDKTPVNENDHIEIRAAVEGGDGSNVIAVILSIVLIVFAPYLAPALGGVLGVSATTAYGLIMVGGQLLIGALFPPKPPNFGGAGANPSPTYNLQGGSNQPRQFQPMPIVLGTTKVIPDLGAAPFVEFEGKDQILFQTFNFGLSDVDLTDFKIGQTPIDDFEEVSYEISDSSGALKLFPGNVDNVAGAELKYEDGWIQRTTSTETQAIGIDIQGTLFQTDKKGRFKNLSIVIQIEYRPVGTTEWLDFASYDPGQPQYLKIFSIRVQIPQNPFGYGLTITNGSTDPVRKMYYRTVPEGQYEVRIRRLTHTFTDDKQNGDLTWSSLRSYQKDNADYTGQKRVAVRIRASGQLNGRIEELSAVASAKIPVWNGSQWVTQASSNPAWQYLYVARGKKNAANRRLFGACLPDSRIDIPKIMEWAAWCDAKNLECNIVFDQPMSVSDMLTTIARCGRGAISFAPGKLSIVYDRENLPVTQMFGMSNIRAGSFQVEYISEKLADEIVINFINPELNWQLDTVKAKSPGVTVPESSVSYDIPGVTNKDQAGREANLQAARQLLNRRRVSFETDAEGLVCSRGQVIAVSHDLTQWSQSGRLASGTTTQLVLDKAAEFNELTQPYISVRHPNGLIETVDVQLEEQATNTITLLTPLSHSPNDDTENDARDYIYQFSPAPTPGKKLKIIHMEHLGNDGNHIKIIAQDEVAAYYDAEDGEFEYIPPGLINTGPSQITNLVITEESISTIDDAVRVVATWQMAQAQGARVRVAKFGEDFKDYGEVYGNSFSFTIDEPTTITVELTPIAVVKTKQAYGVVTLQYTIRGLGMLPEDIPASIPRVNGLELFGGANASEFIGNDAKFVWRKVAGSASELGSEPQGGDSGGEDPYFKDYQVKILNPNGTERRTDYVKDNSYTYTWEKNFDDGGGVPARAFTIEIRGRGIQSQLSAQPARLSVSNPAPAVPGGISVEPLFRNAFLTYTLPTDPDFKGVIVWRGTTSGFEPQESNKVFDGNTNKLALDGLEPGTTYYVRLAGYDAFGKTGINVSSEIAFATTLIEHVDLNIGVVQEVNVADEAITTNKVADAAIATNKLIDGAVLENKLANNAVTLNKVAPGAISAPKILDGAVLEAKLADNAVTLNKVAAGAISSSKLVDGAVIEAKLAANAVTADKIGTGAVLEAKLAAGAVSTSKIQGLAITSTLIADDAITTPKIAANAITANEISAGAVVAGKIAANAVTATEIAAGAVTAGKIQANAITANEIAAGAITATEIAAGAVVAGKIAANAVTANEIAAGAVTANELAANSVVAGKIAADAVTANEIAAGAVTATQLAADAVTAGKIAAGAVTATELAANAVVAGKIAANAVTATEIAAGSISTAKLQAGAVTATEISSNAITSDKINAGAVITSKLAANAVTANEIAANSVTSVKILAGSVEADKIASNAITADKIAANAVTAAKIVAGTITGDRLAANTITTTQLAVLSSSGTSIDMSSGRIVFNNGAVMRVQGTGFGSSNQFVDWFGPTMSVSSCTEANATYYLKTNGDAYFGGALHAGTLTTRGQTSDTGTSAEIVIGPFGSNGGIIDVAYSVTASRVVSSDVAPPGGSLAVPSFTIIVERSVDGGAYSQVASHSIIGTSGDTQIDTQPGDPPFDWRHTQAISASFTYTDNLATTQTRTYRLRRNGAGTDFTGAFQNLSVIATEE